MTVKTLRKLLEDMPDDALVKFVGAWDGESEYRDYMAVGNPRRDRIEYNGVENKSITFFLIPERRRIQRLLRVENAMIDDDLPYFSDIEKDLDEADLERIYNDAA